MTATPQVRHTRGLIIVVLLAIVFLALIAALVITTGKHRPAKTAQAESLSVMPLRVRLRTQPGPQAAVVATATMGEKLTVLEDRDRWVRVQNDEGLSGWTERSLLERTSERARRLGRYEAIRKLPVLNGLVRQRTTLYAGPGIFYPIIGEMPSETQVKVYTRDHDFYAVDHNGEIAYADVEAVDVSSAGTRQFEVSTRTPSPSEPETPQPPQTETTASTAPSPMPMPIPVPVPEPEPATPQIPEPGIYSAVPLGGTQPEEIDRVIPRYPPIARRAGIQGPVMVRGVVRKDGRIDDVEVIKDLPYGLGDAARDAVSRWKFRPATYRGQPIDVYYTVTVNFRLTQ